MALGLGRKNPMPLTLGGGTSSIEIEMRAILDAMEPAFSADDDSINAIQAYAEAFAVSFLWACNRRLSKQAIPLSMSESFADWESACKLRPAIADLDVVRRGRLAAVLRGISGNTRGDLYDACSTLLGVRFTGLLIKTTAQTIAFWPGGPACTDPDGVAICVAPGPPGHEWCSNRMTITVQVSQGGLLNGDLFDLMDRLVVMLDSMTPAWMTFNWITTSGFLVGSSGIGVVGL